MATYIFYTDEGVTIAPNNEFIENLQVLGIEDGTSKQEATMNLFKNNEWIKSMEYSEEKIRCYAILKPNVMKQIKSSI